MEEILHHQTDGWDPNKIMEYINHLSTGAGFRNHPPYAYYIIYIYTRKMVRLAIENVSGNQIIHHQNPGVPEIFFRTMLSFKDNMMHSQQKRRTHHIQPNQWMNERTNKYGYASTTIYQHSCLSTSMAPSWWFFANGNGIERSTKPFNSPSIASRLRPSWTTKFHRWLKLICSWFFDSIRIGANKNGQIHPHWPVRFYQSMLPKNETNDRSIWLSWLRDCELNWTEFQDSWLKGDADVDRSVGR